jgi:hypothetical protein
LHKRIRALSVSKQAVELYEELVSAYVKSMRVSKSDFTISDRRLCWGMDLALAASVLADPECEQIEPTLLGSTKMALINLNEPIEEAVFSEAYSSVIGGYLLRVEEDKTFSGLSEMVNRLRNSFDDSLSKSKTKILLQVVEHVLSGISNIQEGEKPVSPENITRLRAAHAELLSLRSSLLES